MTVNNFLRWFIYAGLVVILFIPLYVSGSMFFPFITGKNFAFRIIIEIIAVLWFALILRDPSYRPARSYLLYAVTGLVAVMGVADLFGVDPYHSFWSNFERMEGYIGLLHLYAFFLILISMLRRRIAWERFFAISFVANLFVCVYALMQIAGKAEIHQGGVRADASLGNATYLAIYCVMHIWFLGFYLYRNYKHKLYFWPVALLIPLNLFVLYHTATRGAILGLIGGVILGALVYLWKEPTHEKGRRIAIWIVAAAIAFCGLFLVFKNTSFVQNSPVLKRFASISLTETTTKSRFLIWEMSLKGFVEHPLLGWGQENYMRVFNKYYDARMYNQEPWFDRSHNVVLDWLIAGGILGFAAYMGVFVLTLYYILRKGSSWDAFEKSLWVGFLLSYFIHNLFVFDNLVSYMFFFMTVAFIHVSTEWVNGGEHKKLEQKKHKVIQEPAAYALISLAIVVCSIALYQANYKPIAASKSLIIASSINFSISNGASGLSPEQVTIGSQNLLQIMQQVIGYNTFGNTEAREQFLQMAVSSAQSSASSDVKQKIISYALDQFKQEFDSHPQDARRALFLGTFYNMFSQPDLALTVLDKAVVLSPQKQLIYVERAKSFEEKNDIVNVLNELKKAYDLEPSFTDVKNYYTHFLTVFGDQLRKTGDRANAAIIDKELLRVQGQVAA